MADVAVGLCGGGARMVPGKASRASIALFDGEDEIDVRIVVDRSIVEVFVMASKPPRIPLSLSHVSKRHPHLV